MTGKTPALSRIVGDDSFLQLASVELLRGMRYFVTPRPGSFPIIFPPFITNFTRCSSAISATRSPETAIRSAYLPLSMDPICSCPFQPEQTALDSAGDQCKPAGAVDTRTDDGNWSPPRAH